MIPLLSMVRRAERVAFSTAKVNRQVDTKGGGLLETGWDRK
jgi:hypothetical protein